MINDDQVEQVTNYLTHTAWLAIPLVIGIGLASVLMVDTFQHSVTTRAEQLK